MLYPQVEYFNCQAEKIRIWKYLERSRLPQHLRLLSQSTCSVTCWNTTQLQSSWGFWVPHWHAGTLFSAPWRLHRKMLSTGPTPAAPRHTGSGQACGHPSPHRSATGAPAAPWSIASICSSGISHEVRSGSKTPSQGVRQPKCWKIALNTDCRDCRGEPSAAHDWRLAWTGPSTSLHQRPAYQENQGHSQPSLTSCGTCQWKQASVGHTRICMGNYLRGCWRQTPNGTCCVKGVASDGQSKWFRTRPASNLLQGSQHEFLRIWKMMQVTSRYYNPHVKIWMSRGLNRAKGHLPHPVLLQENLCRAQRGIPFALFEKNVVA